MDLTVYNSLWTECLSWLVPAFGGAMVCALIVRSFNA